MAVKVRGKEYLIQAFRSLKNFAFCHHLQEVIVWHSIFWIGFVFPVSFSQMDVWILGGGGVPKREMLLIRQQIPAFFPECYTLSMWQPNPSSSLAEAVATATVCHFNSTWLAATCAAQWTPTPALLCKAQGHGVIGGIPLGGVFLKKYNHNKSKCPREEERQHFPHSLTKMGKGCQIAPLGLTGCIQDTCLIGREI